MYWKEWLQGLLALSVLLGILELLLPPGDLAKFSKLVLGFALMIAFLQPIVILFNEGIDVTTLTWPDRQGDELEIEGMAERVKWAAAQPFLEDPASIESMLWSLEELESVQVEIPRSGRAHLGITIWIEPFEEELRKRVLQIVGTVLNIEQSYIMVKEGPK